ncbi:hypothetical protein [Micromonospora sp. WMMD1155]|uniref:hypothetical protein n=1 Tax=Micromonospora sp. WMMD1155 TaxID=3016094 RepID=UPI00249C8C44|nr:hypothetical protein [Micromonospora sp. WMMD1155]WFE48889.1 hypothetical protein O7617_00495 [Micromonospora sp. WMMD1155]
MTYTPPWRRVCDCRCIIHHRLPRTTYNEPGCACTITCATQPLTLLVHQLGRAFFLDQGGDLWHVPAMTQGTWDWDNAARVDTGADGYDAGSVIEQLLRQAANVLGTSTD